MEAMLAIAIGVLTTAGVWLMLRPRTFQVVMGLSLVSYAVNLFIFCMGRLSIDQEPVLLAHVPKTLAHYDDPLPQALVLTAIVIGFAMTALFLVVTMALRGLAGNDHVDGGRAGATLPDARHDLPADASAGARPDVPPDTPPGEGPRR